MLSRDIIELIYVLCVPGLKKKPPLVSCMEKTQCRVSFQGQHCTLIDCTLLSLGTLDICVIYGGLYRFLVGSIALVYSNKKLDEPYSLEEAYAKHSWKDSMEIL